MFFWNSLKLRITVQPVMQKARVVEPKTRHSFVDSHENSVGESVWWAWPQRFARCIANFWPDFGGFLLGWRGLPIYSSTTRSRPTLGLEVYKFYLNLLSFCVFSPSFLL